MLGLDGWRPRFVLEPGALGQSVSVERDGELLGVGTDRGHAIRILIGDISANADRYDDWTIDDRTAQGEGLS